MKIEIIFDIKDEVEKMKEFKNLKRVIESGEAANEFMEDMPFENLTMTIKKNDR